MDRINNNYFFSGISDKLSRTCTKISLMEQWEEWAQKAQPGAGEQRDVALERLKECLEHSIPSLDLSNLNLTDLPRNWPDCLWDLSLSHNQLTYLPEHLPSSIRELYVSHNRLMQLPETLPPNLEIMDLNHNQITYLPQILPDNLKDLHLANNLLTDLPVFIAPKLRDLHIDHNQLTHLREGLPSTISLLSVSHNNLTSIAINLPFMLFSLNLSNNQLTHLPENLPSSLYILEVAHNQLTYLPENLPNGLGTLEAKHNHLSRLPLNLPPELEVMDVSHNQLTYLPENLPSSLEIMIASHNHLRHLPEHLPHHLEGLDVSHNQLTRVPDTLPNRVRTFSISNNPVGIENETTLYFMVALNSLSNRIDINRWKDIAKEENAAIFFDFFLRLFQGENVSSVKFKQSVSTWIAELGKEENADLRQQTFAIAKDGTENCIDRASYYFNLMYSLMIEHRLVKHNVPVEEIFQTLLGLFRLQEIESISAEHASKRRNKTPGFEEDIEIYLAYQYRLREELALPIYTELQFSDIAGLTEENIMYAKDRILEKEKQKFIAFLVNDSDVWKRKITEWKCEKVEAADKEFLEKLDGMTAGSATSDLYNIMDKNKTDEVHYKIFFPLTKDYLTEKGALQMLDGFHY